jgi:hypothetical protein
MIAPTIFRVSFLASVDIVPMECGNRSTLLWPANGKVGQAITSAKSSTRNMATVHNEILTGGSSLGNVEAA